MICNPHTMNISICNAHNSYFADYKSDGMGKNKLSKQHNSAIRYVIIFLVTNFLLFANFRDKTIKITELVGK